MESVDSTTFIKRPPHMTKANEVFLYTKEILSRRIFLGSYEERRYVTVLKEYRDVILVNSEEKDLQADLEKIRKKWIGISEIKWVGITGPDLIDVTNASCIWVKLSNLPFGQYWFQIKHVKCTNGEVFVQLKCIRKALSSELQTISPTRKSLITRNETPITSTMEQSETSRINLYVKTTLESTNNFLAEAKKYIFQNVTWQNVSTVVRVVMAVTISIICGFISIIPSIGEFALKLIRELTFFVQAASPIIIQIIDLITKVLGGLLILFASIFNINIRGNAYPNRNHQNERILNNWAIAPRNVNWRERNHILRRELLGMNNMAR